MSVKERVLSIVLMEKIKNNLEYAKKLGLEVEEKTKEETKED